MKTFVAVALLGLIVAFVAAHGGSREEGFGGRFTNCKCRNQCSRNTGTKNLGCNIRNQYLQCVDTVCSNQTCPDNQLFNSTSLQCESCKTGFHVDAQKRGCVCDQGTTLDKSTGTCGPCPTGANVTADRCFCNYPQVLDKANNACKTCPAGSNRTREGCRCSSKQQLWSTADFICKDCPGSWVNVTVGGWFKRTVQVCNCTSATEVVNPYSITCVACPANSELRQEKGEGSYCRCTVSGQVYDAKTNACVARSSLKGYDSFGSFGSFGSHEGF